MSAAVAWLLAGPIVLPIGGAIALWLLPRQRNLHAAVTVAVSGATLLVALGLLTRVVLQGIAAAQMGDWPAPFGISLVADPLSATMVVVCGVMALATAVYSLQDVSEEEHARGFHPVFLGLVAGVNGAFLTGDLFNLYVWFEVMLIGAFVLLTLGRTARQVEGGIKYVAVNLVASLLFLAAVGLLFGLTGTLNMAHLALVLPDAPPGLVTTIAMLLLVAFGIKAALFPLFFWLPAAYPTPSVAVSAFFAAMLTKVGVYALIRSFTLLFTHDVAYTHTLLLWISMATMLTGVLGAAAQSGVRRILSFHIVSQIGYMLMGLALYTPLGLVGAVFYLVHHIIVKGNLFLISGIMKRIGGSFELSKLGGLYVRHPLLAALFLIPAFSLAGFPPLSGFWAKLLVIRAGLEVEAWLAVAVALVTGLLTIYSMTKIWQNAFWGSAPATPATAEGPVWRRYGILVAPVAVLAAITVVIGLWAEPLVLLAERAAADLLEPTSYIAAVLGEDAVASLVDTGGSR